MRSTNKKKGVCRWIVIDVGKTKTERDRKINKWIEEIGIGGNEEYTGIAHRIKKEKKHVDTRTETLTQQQLQKDFRNTEMQTSQEKMKLLIGLTDVQTDMNDEKSSHSQHF